MLDLARHIVEQKSRRFERFEDHYETGLADLINTKRAGQPIAPKERAAAGTIVDLTAALHRSIDKDAAPAKVVKPGKKPREVASGQNEMLMPTACKTLVQKTVAKKPAARPQRKSA